MNNKLARWVLGLRNRHFCLLDTIGFLITPVLALQIRLDESFAIAPYLSGLIVATILFMSVKLTVFYKLGFYKRYWRYASIDELEQVAALTIVAVVVQTLFFNAFYLTNLSVDSLPRSLPLLDGILSFLLVGAIRFSIPAIERISKQHKKFHRRDRALIVGAGSAGVTLVQQIQRNPLLGLYPVAFVDDDPKKLNLRICGLNVVGNRYKIPEVVRSLHIGRVIIAMPTAPGRVIREIVDICQSIGVPTSTIPGIHEIVYGRASVVNVRDVQIEDLLRREPIQTDVQKVSEFIRGKKVLITGAGGSIGSELCRQILKCRPAEMVLVGHGENSVFTIQQELQRVLESLKKNGEDGENLPLITAFIADMRFAPRLKYAFEKYRPEIVFHAAAHKHVPMMELNPPEAITNNVRGTKNLLDLALQYGVEHFVMISTDKAVNPTNIMGASKRVAEMLVLRAAQKSGKPFVVVRFGNVLGSRGSVVPTFKQQIAQGGPITITHPDICRYFMTIPEAVQLVLQAAVLGRGGEVFMLDMGKPIKIVDLAKDLIRLSGYELGKDIDIVFSGLRPGEKLYEELFISGEEYHRTEHEKILTAGNASRIVSEMVDSKIEALCAAAKQNNSNLIVFLLERLVPEYTPGYSTVHLHALEHDLRQAIENQEFQVHYQPIMSLETDRVIGFEALLRWQHPTRGLVSPADFIPVAEETGSIVPIGWWVLREACRQMHAWQQKFPANMQLTMGVNLSSKQFFQPDLIQQIHQILKETKLNASSLRLEIPVDVIEQNPELATTVFGKLKALEVQLQIDNCGGDSSLNYLYDLTNLTHGQIDSLKVDRSLIRGIDTDDASSKILQQLMTISQELGMSIIATGVETTGQIARLRALKCVYGQGYFFCEPVEGEAAQTLIGVKSAKG